MPDGRKIDFSTVLVDILGDPFKVAKKGVEVKKDAQGNPIPLSDDQQEPMTLGVACKIALTSPLQETQASARSFDDMMLAIKVSYAGEIEVSETDLERIRERAGKVFATPELVGRIVQVLRGEKQLTAKGDPA